MANGQNTEIVKGIIPILIEAIKGWWQRRQQRKKEQADGPK
jgi:hypothetical protein